ncbi:sporulation integral membrane protein YlbJ [Clostridium sp. MB05]|jgi:sporulation integral membrane protein YlbJ|uniref:sporulation integral membrane protein YlbJ n=1 Tax=Clostridium sp. MB05 TaxID=3376682 RepID=UPI003981F790
MFSIFILWLFIFFLVALLLKLLDVKKNYIICFAITIFIIIFVINLEVSISAAISGAKLVVVAILPTIFPFSVICNLLIYYDGITLYSKILGPLICKPLGLSKSCSFPLAASFICGYPLGAKYSSDIYDLGYIHKSEYERLLNIASNAGPIFILGSVSASMLYDVKLGYILLIANYLSIVVVGFLTRKNSKNITSLKKMESTYKENPFGTNLKNAIESAISTTINVGAFVIIFSVFISIIKSNTYISTAFENLENLIKLPNGILYNLFLGSIEFTNGCKLISTSNISMSLKLSMMSFILSFSSLSVIAQVSSIVSKNNPNMKKYIFYKFIQGIISFIITFISSNIIQISTTTSNITNDKIYNILSFYKLFIPFIVFLLLTLLISMLLKHVSILHSS